jgi:DNA-binding transcriptional ArsR family regulator
MINNELETTALEPSPPVVVLDMPSAIAEVAKLNTEIDGAYGEICKITELTLPKAVRQGQLLVRLQDETNETRGKGHWMEFCKDELSFMSYDLIATRMRLYNERERISGTLNSLDSISVTAALKEIGNGNRSKADKEIYDFLFKAGDATQEEIAAGLRKHPSNISRSLSRLREAGRIKTKVDASGSTVKRSRGTVVEVASGNPPTNGTTPPPATTAKPATSTSTKPFIINHAKAVTLDGFPVRLALFASEIKMFNRALNPACLDQEERNAATALIQSLKKRYHNVDDLRIS